jgi:hypothetical protein
MNRPSNVNIKTIQNNNIETKKNKTSALLRLLDFTTGLLATLNNCLEAETYS